MTLNIIPPRMRARHIDTGEWYTLSLNYAALWWMRSHPQDHYAIETGEEPIWADLNDFDSFEAAQ